MPGRVRGQLQRCSGSLTRLSTKPGEGHSRALDLPDEVQAMGELERMLDHRLARAREEGCREVSVQEIFEAARCDEGPRSDS